MSLWKRRVKFRCKTCMSIARNRYLSMSTSSASGTTSHPSCNCTQWRRNGLKSYWSSTRKLRRFSTITSLNRTNTCVKSAWKAIISTKCRGDLWMMTHVSSLSDIDNQSFWTVHSTSQACTSNSWRRSERKKSRIRSMMRSWKSASRWTCSMQSLNEYHG